MSSFWRKGRKRKFSAAFTRYKEEVKRDAEVLVQANLETCVPTGRALRETIRSRNRPPQLERPSVALLEEFSNRSLVLPLYAANASQWQRARHHDLSRTDKAVEWARQKQGRAGPYPSRFVTLVIIV